MSARIKDELPLAAGVQAFSIDDSATTEIDDALSVQGLGSGMLGVALYVGTAQIVPKELHPRLFALFAALVADRKLPPVEGWAPKVIGEKAHSP